MFSIMIAETVACVPAPETVSVMLFGVEIGAPGLVQSRPVTEPEPVKLNVIVACVMPVEMFGSVGFGRITGTGGVG